MCSSFLLIASPIGALRETQYFCWWNIGIYLCIQYYALPKAIKIQDFGHLRISKIIAVNHFVKLYTLRIIFLFSFQLLSYIWELHAEKVCEQPHEFLVNILAVIELGLTLFGTQITGICCEFIQFFSRHLCLHAAQLQPEKFLLLQPFLKVFLI